MDFYIGQIFINSYPPQAASWCTEAQIAHIEQTTKVGDISRTFVIVANDKPNITKSDLIQFVYKEKCKVAFTGVIIQKNNEKYLFETNQNSITMANGKATAIFDKPEDFQINWKTWKDNLPVILTLTKKEFNEIFNFSMQMIDLTFALEGKLNLQVQSFSEEQLQDNIFINQFKENVINQFKQINIEFTFDVQ